MQITRERVEVFLFIVLGGISLNLVGAISLSEIYLLLISPRIINSLKQLTGRELKEVSILYGVYLTFQLVSEVANENEFNNWARGVAVTIFSFLTFIFLFTKFYKDTSLILVVLVALIVRNVFFASSLSDDSEMSFFKFYVVPIVSNTVIVISYYLLKIKRENLNILMFLSVGIFFVLMDSRTGGLVLVAVGLLMRFGDQLKRNKLSLLILALIMYTMYFVYVDGLLNRRFGGEHGYVQISRIENPYNPFNLLMTGRAETFVAIEAIKDRPLFGHGAWAKDVTGKYHLMVLYLHNSDNDSAFERVFSEGIYSVIPSHSVIFGAGVYNGVLAMLAMLSLVLYFVRKGFNALDFKSVYVAILLNSILGLCWSALFSPISSFKGSLPISFAIILALFIYRKRSANPATFRHKTGFTQLNRNSV